MKQGWLSRGFRVVNSPKLHICPIPIVAASFLASLIVLTGCLAFVFPEKHANGQGTRQGYPSTRIRSTLTEPRPFAENLSARKRRHTIEAQPKISVDITAPFHGSKNKSPKAEFR
jgi:hypothetical protein